MTGILGNMLLSGSKRLPKMVTIRNLQEMKAAAHENDPKTKLLVLGLGEAIVTTCGQARLFLELVKTERRHHQP
jgi:hypothetical protein